jgi:hypothetical protein
MRILRQQHKFSLRGFYYFKNLDPKYVTDYNGFVKTFIEYSPNLILHFILFIGLYATINRLIRKIMIKGI